MDKEMLDVTLNAEPEELAMSELSKLKISISVTNKGTVAVDPELHRTTLHINGELNLFWSDTIGSGRHSVEWHALPPGETISQTWSAVGKYLFLEPNEYELALRIDETELSRSSVKVNPG